MGYQLSSLERSEFDAAVTAMAEAEIEFRGAVFTRREVVEFMLDLAGYTSNKPLFRARILEPSMGGGDFLLSVIDRLFEACERQRAVTGGADLVDLLGDCIVGVEVHRATFERTQGVIAKKLREKGLRDGDAVALCRRWLHLGDFLLLPFEQKFTHVVGNPPYIRQELIPDILMEEYRRRYQTIFDRADIYVPFMERALSLLLPGGTLSFICADRWIKNRYGSRLRRLVADHYRLRCFVDMSETSAFHSDVIAYPAIVVINREKAGPTRVAAMPDIQAEGLRTLAGAMLAPRLGEDARVSEIERVAVGSEPWMVSASAQLKLIRKLETEYPSLEDAGCRVGIGVATGADEVFIGPFDGLDVEPDRKLPLVMTGDILSGSVKWRGLGVINPFGADGKLVALRDYPKLARYVEEHRQAIKARHVAKKNPTKWYRTIDRIYPELAGQPKLLIPDIKDEAHVVYESGSLYPHHNLYFITSAEWDLHALQAVLLSDVTRTFIALYSTKMRGGYLRFQAQYLRRLRLPHWGNVPGDLRKALRKAGKARDFADCNIAARELYKLTKEEAKAIAAGHDANGA